MLWFRRRIHPTENELSAFLDEELGKARSLALAAHFETCATCRSTLEDLRAVHSLVSRLPNPGASRSFTLTAEVAGASTGARPPRRLSLSLSPAVALTVLVALLAVDFGGWSGSTSNDQASRSLALNAESAAVAGDDGAKSAGGAAAEDIGEGNDGGGSGEPSALSSETPAAANAGAIPEASDGRDSQATSGLAPEAPSAEDADTGSAASAPQGAGESTGETATGPLPSDSTSDEGGGGRDWLRVLEILAALALGASLWFVLINRRGRQLR